MLTTMTKFQAGERVFSPHTLRQGTVEAVRTTGAVTVRWDDHAGRKRDTLDAATLAYWAGKRQPALMRVDH